MSNTRNTGFLTNVVKYTDKGDISFVSGSTTLMSISSSGAVTVTGVISGSNALTSSYSQNSELLDNLDSTAFVFTSSFNTYSSSMSTRVSNTESTGSTLTSASASLNTASGSFSTRVTRIEGNYATTGSNVFLGAQTVCANITSTGTIIAQTLNVQQVTSSVVYSSGSNVFGCSLANTQQFTGSVLMTGSLTVFTAGTSPEFQVVTGGTIKGNITTDVHQVTGSFRVTGSGNHWIVGGSVGINTTSPDPFGRGDALNVGISATGASDNMALSLNAGASGGRGSQIYMGQGGTRHFTLSSNITETTIGTVTNTPFRINTCDTTRLYVSSSTGNIGIGTTSPSNLLHIYGTDGNSYIRWTSDVATTGTRIGYNGTEFRIDQQQSADITLRTNGCERMRITSGGNVGIGTCSPSNTALHIVADWVSGHSTVKAQPSTGTTSGYGVYDNTGARKGIFYRDAGYVAIETNSEPLLLNTNGIERMRITSTGIACFACQVCAGGRISAISSGVDGAFADTFVGIYSGNNNEQNAIQTSVSSIAESSGFLFMVSCGAGLSTRSCGYRMVRNRHTFYVNNSCAVTIDSSGQVGIGTNPGSLLHTSGPSNIFKHFTTTNNGTWIEFQANSTNVVRPFYVGQDNSAGGSFGVGGYAGVVFTSSGDPVVLATASTARLTVAGNGIATFACQVCAPIFTTVNGVAAVGAGPSTTDIFTATGPVSSNGMYLILYNQQGAPGGSTGMAFINIWNNAQVDVYNVYCLGLSNVVNSGTTIRIQSLSGNGGFTAVYSAIRLR